VTALPLDADTWRRRRGWTLWKALIVLAEHGEAAPLGRWAHEVIDAVFVDHRSKI